MCAGLVNCYFTDAFERINASLLWRKESQKLRRTLQHFKVIICESLVLTKLYLLPFVIPEFLNIFQVFFTGWTCVI